MKAAPLKFLIKTGLYGMTPGGFGYYRRLRKELDPEYTFEYHQQNKNPIRNKHHGTEGWRKNADTINYREYEDYDEYLLHQTLKYQEILKGGGSLLKNRTIVSYRLKFYRRFRHLPKFLPHAATILCAGARQGTEVEVLRDLGYVNAYGIDLEPGPDNRLVKQGDFMNLDAEKSSIDMIYCNSLDHAFELDMVFAEHARVLKPDEYVMYDLAMGQFDGPSPFEAVRWESEKVIISLMFKYFKEIRRIEEDRDWKWVLLQGKM